jgi:glycosyltransferase involved in cell wall biosynthesis
MNLAASLGIGTKVRCLNYVPAEHLTQLLQQALALVFPSLWEGFGFPVLEAMACGTAVITSGLSSLPEVTANAALLVNPYQVSELTAAMTAIATDASLRRELEVKGLARAQQLTWEKTGLATREVLANYL